MTDELEQWRPVVGFRGYEVSNRGRVRSYLTTLGPQAQLRRTAQIVGRRRHDAQGRECVELAGKFGRVLRVVSMLIDEAFAEERVT